MGTVLVDNLDKRLAADAESGNSQRRMTNRFDLSTSNTVPWIRRRQHGHGSAGRQGSRRRIASLLLVVAGVLVIVATVPAQTYDPPVTTLVKNTGQPVPDRITNLSAKQTGLYQGFTTGPNPFGYELDSISLYVGNSHDSRDLTIRASLYQGNGRLTRVTALDRSGLRNRAHNEWKAPPNTYLEPSTSYYIVLDCTVGCEGDNLVEVGLTDSSSEDSGAEAQGGLFTIGWAFGRPAPARGSVL